MNTLQYFVDAIIVINLRRRRDRWEHCMREFESIGINPLAVCRFEAYDKPLDHNGVPNGNKGCSESHRGVLEWIAREKLNRVLVCEDDITVRPEYRDNFNATFDLIAAEIPDNAKLVYLGGGYADNPKRRHSPHLIEINRMLTTSSYIIGHQMAREMAPYISGVGPIDNLFHGFTERGGCYCSQPRLFVQYTSLSDLTDREADYGPSMCDTRHEEMLIEGEWSDEGYFITTLTRRELTVASDMIGDTVIVDGQCYTVERAIPPTDRGPWYRGSKIVLSLKPTA
jgi:hypothetical protein